MGGEITADAWASSFDDGVGKCVLSGGATAYGFLPLRSWRVPGTGFDTILPGLSLRRGALHLVRKLFLELLIAKFFKREFHENKLLD